MFVHASKYRAAVADVVSSPGELRLAVAFLGKGAAECIGRHPGTVRLVCNLASGGTNPFVVEALRGRSNVTILQLDALHAKVFTVDSKAVVGSANLSANGLGLESSEQSGWHEAGMSTVDEKELSAISRWFEEIWEMAREITDEDIANARKKWRTRRAGRPIGGNVGESFDLQKISIEELADRRLYVVLCKNNIDEEAKQRYWDYHRKKTGKELVKSQKLPPIYQAWDDLPKRGLLIDVFCGARGAVTCEGVFKRLYDIPTSKKDDDVGVLTVCERKSELLGRRFAAAERKSFGSLVRPKLNEIWNAAKGDGAGRYIEMSSVKRILDLA